MKFPILQALPLALSLLAGPVWAQVEVLDQAQDQVGTPAAPPPPCGTQPISIAQMSWPSATLLAEIHTRLLTSAFGCEVRLTPGDLAATASAMGSTGQPAVAPEMWVNRIADVWNGAMEGQMLRSAAPTYAETQFEGWFMPSYMAGSFPEGPSAAGLAAAMPTLMPEGRIQFISCPIDWACSVINRNLLAAHGLADLVDIVEPANRFEMDQLIAEAVNRREPFLFYYWQPNPVLAQLEFTPVGMGEYDAEAMACLADRDCAAPLPSAFPTDLVVIAVAERIFVDAPMVAGYFQRASLPLGEMDRMLAELNAPGATPQAVADRFVAERQDIWQGWVGNAPTP
jgi:glycine betaine/proline transport system substrate-binding protein